MKELDGLQLLGVEELGVKLFWAPKEELKKVSYDFKDHQALTHLIIVDHQVLPNLLTL